MSATDSAGPSTALTLDRIGQIAIVVQDVARATAFYRDVLGMRFLFQAPPGLAFFDCGGVRLMLSASEGSDASIGTSVLYYTVPDIGSAYDTLVARGVQFAQPPHRIAAMPDHDLWMGFFRDSEENLVGLMSEVPRA
jgi:methylmalonyl-CoA/ethylmalonyl-CoA epimerase